MNLNWANMGTYLTQPQALNMALMHFPIQPLLIMIAVNFVKKVITVMSVVHVQLILMPCRNSFGVIFRVA